MDYPDLYRGRHKDDANPALKYAQQVHTAIKKANEKGRNVSVSVLTIFNLLKGTKTCTYIML